MSALMTAVLDVDRWTPSIRKCHHARAEATCPDTTWPDEFPPQEKWACHVCKRPAVGHRPCCSCCGSDACRKVCASASREAGAWCVFDWRGWTQPGCGLCGGYLITWFGWDGLCPDCRALPDDYESLGDAGGEPECRLCCRETDLDDDGICNACNRAIEAQERVE